MATQSIDAPSATRKGGLCLFESERGSKVGLHGCFHQDATTRGIGDDYAMSEVHEESLTARNFLDSGGKRLDFGEIPLDDDEIVSEEPITQRDPEGVIPLVRRKRTT
jgi:hypothetical protein